MSTRVRYYLIATVSVLSPSLKSRGVRSFIA